MHSTGLPFDLPVEREIQTHANLVLLTTDRAYKLKKPVKFPFLDYSTLALRREMILNELHLNRRFAPDTYLGVEEVSERNGKLHVSELRDDLPASPAPDVIDYCVVMQRIPEDAWLPILMREGRLGENDIISLMQRLVTTYQSEPANDEVKANGLPENLRHNTVANIAECQPYVPECLSRESWQRLDALLRGWFEANHEVFQTRVRQDRIRDAHGDLKPGNIAFVEGAPVITDCIEFNPLFRRIDTLCEVAFLATGLESLGAFDISAHVLDAYREIAGDDYPENLRRYYQAHLACVMAKVTGLQLNEPDVPQAQKDRARALAAHYFALADFHAREPHVVVVMGIMGCGKSTVANAIGRHFGWRVVNSDIERKRIAGVARDARLPASAYTDDSAAVVYDALYAAVGDDSGVVLDAQFPTPEFRAGVVEAAKAKGGHVVFVHCDAPDALVAERMRQRELDPSRVSDATADLLKSARERFQPPTASEELSVIQFDTREDVAKAIVNLKAALLGPVFDPQVAQF